MPKPQVSTPTEMPAMAAITRDSNPSVDEALKAEKKRISLQQGRASTLLSSSSGGMFNSGKGLLGQ